MENNIGEKNKGFFATNWAINNKTSTYVIIAFIVVLGVMSYISIPKEQFPEIVIPHNTCYYTLSRDFTCGY